MTFRHHVSALSTLHYIHIYVYYTYLCYTYIAYMYFADIIIGVPSLQAHNLDAKIREERCRYLVAELVCRVRYYYIFLYFCKILQCLQYVNLNFGIFTMSLQPEYEDSLELLCGFIKKQLRRATTEKFEVERESSQLLPVSIPFVFGTPGGAAVDLRLFSRDIIRKALPTLVAILERETRGWFLHFRERLISELRAQKKPDEEIERVRNFCVKDQRLTICA